MTTLDEHLERWARGRPDRLDQAAVIQAVAAAAAELAGIVAQGPLAGALGSVVGASRDGDGQKALDVRAEELFLARLREAPIAWLASEEQEEAVSVQPGAPLALALDPLDGSNNIDQDGPMGSIFALLPAEGTAEATFLVPGSRQLAAGVVLYGPYTVLILGLEDRVDVFTLDRRSAELVLTREAVQIPPGRREYAINASNARHWPLPVRAYIEECVAGISGPRGVDYNMRWVACIAADLYRILVRGGIYLYPGDARKGYERGRLRLLYEGFPIAFLVERAGGLAIDGYSPILELVPKSLHERVPLIFGSRDKVERVIELHHASVPPAGQRPLFAARGLFKS